MVCLACLLCDELLAVISQEACAPEVRYYLCSYTKAVDHVGLTPAGSLA